MIEPSEAFSELLEQTARLQQDIREESPIKYVISKPLESNLSEIVIAAELRDSCYMRAKCEERIRKLAEKFLKHAIPEGNKIEIGPFKINHYYRQQIDHAAAKHYAATSEETKEDYQAKLRLEARMKELRELFYVTDSSIRITRKENHEDIN